MNWIRYDLNIAVIVTVLAVTGVTSADAAPEIIVESKAFEPGEPLVVGLYCIDAVDVGGVTVELSWNGNALWTGAAPVPTGLAGGGISDAMPVVHPDDAGSMRLNVTVPSGFSGSGLIATLSFSIPDSLSTVPGDTLVLGLVSAEVYDTSYDLVPVILTEGILTFEAFQVGTPGTRVNPAMTMLRPPYPVPSRSRVTIPLFLQAPGRIEVNVFDVQGRVIRRLFSGRAEPGITPLIWDGLDDQQQRASAGVYFVRAVTETGRSGSRRVVLLP